MIALKWICISYIYYNSFWTISHTGLFIKEKTRKTKQEKHITVFSYQITKLGEIKNWRITSAVSLTCSNLLQFNQKSHGKSKRNEAIVLDGHEHKIWCKSNIDELIQSERTNEKLIKIRVWHFLISRIRIFCFLLSNPFIPIRNSYTVYRKPEKLQANITFHLFW